MRPALHIERLEDDLALDGAGVLGVGLKPGDVRDVDGGVQSEQVGLGGDRVNMNSAPPTLASPASGNDNLTALAERAVLDLSDLFDTALDQIRQAAYQTPAVLIQLAHVCGQLASVLPDAVSRNPLQTHLQKISRAGQRHIEDTADRSDFIAAVATAQRTLREQHPCDDKEFAAKP